MSYHGIQFIVIVNWNYEGGKFKTADVVLGIFKAPNELHMLLDAEEGDIQTRDVNNVVKWDGLMVVLGLLYYGLYYGCPHWDHGMTYVCKNTYLHYPLPC